MTVEFLLISIVVILLPGTGVLYTLAIGLGQGFKASVFAAFGCTLGILPAAGASIVGLSALLHSGAVAFQVVKYLGVVWLFYMAWNILREDGPMDVDEDRQRTSGFQTVRDGFLLNVLNPKLSLFFLAFLPQFVSAEQADSSVILMWLALVFMVLTFVVFAGYGLCAAVARDFVLRRPTVLLWIRRAFAAAFGFLGAKLAFFQQV